MYSCVLFPNVRAMSQQKHNKRTAMVPFYSWKRRFSFSSRGDYFLVAVARRPCGGAALSAPRFGLFLCVVKGQKQVQHSAAEGERMGGAAARVAAHR